MSPSSAIRKTVRQVWLIARLDRSPASKQTDLDAFGAELAVACMCNVYQDLTTNIRAGGLNLKINGQKVDVKHTKLIAPWNLHAYRATVMPFSPCDLFRNKKGNTTEVTIEAGQTKTLTGQSINSFRNPL